MKMFAAKVVRAGVAQYLHVYPTEHQVTMCGHKPVPVEVAELEQGLSGGYFAWSSGDTFHHFQPSLELLRMCSPDAFVGAIGRYEGKIVKVSLTEAQLGHHDELS